jgi:hypothetical protein
MTPTVDRDQVAAPRRLRSWFGDVQVLEVVEVVESGRLPGRNPAPGQATQGELFQG